MATVTPFPALGFDVRYTEYTKPAPAYMDVTYSQTFADKSIAVNAVTSTALQKWIILIDGLLEFEADVYSRHYDEAFGDLNDFVFVEKNGTSNSNCRYSKFERSKLPHSTLSKISIEITKYPG